MGGPWSREMTLDEVVQRLPSATRRLPRPAIVIADWQAGLGHGWGRRPPAPRLAGIASGPFCGGPGGTASAGAGRANMSARG